MNYFNIAYKTVLCALLIFSNVFGMKDLPKTVNYDTNELAQQNYQIIKNELNNKIKNKTNISIEEWSNYLEAEKNYQQIIPKEQPLYNKLTREIEKTESRITSKTQQLELKQLVNQQKKAVQLSPTLENLKSYKAALRNYIAILPNKQMKIEPEKTLIEVDQKIKQQDNILDIINEKQKHLQNILMETRTDYIDPNTFKEFSQHIQELKQLNSPKALSNIQSYKENIAENTALLMRQIARDNNLTIQVLKERLDSYFPETDTLLQPYRAQVMQVLAKKQAQDEEIKQLMQKTHSHMLEGRQGAATHYGMIADKKIASAIEDMVHSAEIIYIINLQKNLRELLRNNESTEQLTQKIKELENKRFLKEIQEMTAVSSDIISELATKIAYHGKTYKSITSKAQELFKLFPIVTNTIATIYYPDLRESLYDSLEFFSTGDMLKVIEHYNNRMLENKNWLSNYLLDSSVNYQQTPNYPTMSKAMLTSLNNVMQAFEALEQAYINLNKPKENKEPELVTNAKEDVEVNINPIESATTSLAQNNNPEDIEQQTSIAPTEPTERTKKSVQLKHDKPEQKQPEVNQQPEPNLQSLINMEALKEKDKKAQQILQNIQESKPIEVPNSTESIKDYDTGVGVIDNTDLILDAIYNIKSFSYLLSILSNDSLTKYLTIDKQESGDELLKRLISLDVDVNENNIFTCLKNIVHVIQNLNKTTYIYQQLQEKKDSIKATLIFYFTGRSGNNIQDAPFASIPNEQIEHMINQSLKDMPSSEKNDIINQIKNGRGLPSQSNIEKSSENKEPEQTISEKDSTPSIPSNITYKEEHNISFGDSHNPNRVTNDQRRIFDPLKEKSKTTTAQAILNNNQQQPAPDNNEPWYWSVLAAPFRAIGGLWNWFTSLFA